MPGTEPKASGDCFATARVQLLFGQTFATLCQLECGFNRRTQKKNCEGDFVDDIYFLAWPGCGVVGKGEGNGFKKKENSLVRRVQRCRFPTGRRD